MQPDLRLQGRLESLLLKRRGLVPRHWGCCPLLPAGRRSSTFKRGLSAMAVRPIGRLSPEMKTSWTLEKRDRCSCRCLFCPNLWNKVSGFFGEWTSWSGPPARGSGGTKKAGPQARQKAADCNRYATRGSLRASAAGGSGGRSGKPRGLRHRGNPRAALPRGARR